MSLAIEIRGAMFTLNGPKTSATNVDRGNRLLRIRTCNESYGWVMTDNGDYTLDLDVTSL